MNLSHFHRVRSGMQHNAHPGHGPELDAVAGSLQEALLDSGLFIDVEVEPTDDPDRLVIAMCRFDPFFSEADIAARLEDTWSDRVRYPFWEAHAFLSAEDHVELEAASRVGPEGHYVTVHLVAQRAPIPEQRTSSR